MKHPGQIVKEYREKAGMTQPQLCQMLAERGIDVPRQQLYRWEKDGKMGSWVLLNICDILEIPNVPRIFLYEKEQAPMAERPVLNNAGVHLERIFHQLLADSPRYKHTAVQVDPTRTISKYNLAVSAGTGQPDPGSGYDDVPRPLSAPEGSDVVIMVVSGDSMLPEYEDGDNIYVRKKKLYQNGDIVIVRRNEEFFIKKLVMQGGRIVRLDSLNDQYGPVELREFDEVEIQGEVLGKVS